MTRTESEFDVLVVGGGIIGLATAMALTERHDCSVVVIEAEERLARHQTGHNSGVIHSGLYYRPGSLKAQNCVAGREALIRFCDEHGVPYERCGKVVVATSQDELPRLAELARRGRENGLSELREIGPDELCALEPHAAGVRALHVPETGIVDFGRVALAFAERIRERDGVVETGTRFLSARTDASGVVAETTRGVLRARGLVNCAGLRADRVARACGLRPDVRIVPFRGDYFEVRRDRRFLVRNLVYPVPDPRFPFLGIHLTRTIDGRLEAGPNAVLALRREGYSRWSFSMRDTFETLAWPGFWRMARSFWRTAARELVQSLSHTALTRDAARLVPAIRPEDLRRAGCGIRAQAVDRQGNLLDDFHVVPSDRGVHVLNAPSPAATASIPIGEFVAGLVRQRLA